MADTKEDTRLTLIDRAVHWRTRTAVVDDRQSYTYGDLLDASARVAGRLLRGAEDLAEGRVALIVPAGFEYVAVQWGIWRAGGIAVPLSPSHPAPELDYVIGNSGASVVVAGSEWVDRIGPIAGARGATILHAQELMAPGTDSALPHVDEGRGALILYTSGTTSRPKGVVTTHANIRAQVETLVDAWGWRSDDHILLVLPLHHVHGIINVLTCGLWSGAKITMHERFEPEAVWDELAAGKLTLFMAVPTIYSGLIETWEAADDARRRELSAGCRELRLMVSGSAALPVTVLERWRQISGHTLLERYGMTEIGMALSNPLEGERRPGHVGLPLPGVEVRLVDGDGRAVPPGEPGEIEVRGPSVFREYWGNPDATREGFRDGWFRTGDVASLDDGYYRILGRSSVDIIKTGGYKVSALEVEEVLRAHPAVSECAVVGIPDEKWGEILAAACVLGGEEALTLEAMRTWCGSRLAPYKVPRLLRVVDDLPRNAMGKVTKQQVKRLFE